MTNLVALKESPPAWEAPASKPLDEAVWRAWVARGLEEDRRSSAVFVKAAQWIVIAVLIAASALWSQVTTYAVAIRFVVAAGAIIVMSRAISSRQYAVAAMFAFLVLVYNPVAPPFGFAGGAQHAFVAGTAVLFAAALVWRRDTEARNA